MKLTTFLSTVALIPSLSLAYPGQDKDVLDPNQRPNVHEPGFYNMTKQDKEIIINGHNYKRSLHENTGNLTWNDTLANFAAKFVANYNCASGSIEHSDWDFGENIAIGHSVNGSINGWYNEIKDYDFSKSEFSESTGHFTQVIWKDTTQVGCAVRYCNSYWGNITVCEYNPSGNWDGEFKNNVMPLKSAKAKRDVVVKNTTTVIYPSNNTTTTTSCASSCATSTAIVSSSASLPAYQGVANNLKPHYALSILFFISTLL